MEKTTTTTNSTWTTRQQHKLGIMLGRTWKTRISTCSEDNDTARCCFRAWAHPRSQLVSGAKKKTTQLFALTFEVVMDLISARASSARLRCRPRARGPSDVAATRRVDNIADEGASNISRGGNTVVGALRRTAGHGGAGGTSRSVINGGNVRGYIVQRLEYLNERIYCTHYAR